MGFLEQFFGQVDTNLPDNLLSRIKPADLRTIMKSLGLKLYTDVSEKATGYSAYQVWLQQPGNAGKTEAQFFEAIRGLKPRGPWTALTAYAVNDAVENGGNMYVVTTAHTSPASFSTANLTLFLQGGTVADGGIGPRKTSFFNESGIFNLNIAAPKVNGVAFDNEDAFFLLLKDILGYVALQIDLDGKMKNTEVDTKLLKIASQVGFESDGTGGLIIRNLITNQVILAISSGGKIVISDLVVQSTSEEPFPFAFTDPAGNVCIGWTRDGVPVGLSGSSATVQSESGFMADINHVVVYGQSLSVGGNTGSALTTVQRSGFNSLMFSGGAVTWESQVADAATVHSSLVSLIEGASRESPCSGVSESLLERIQAENALAPTDHDYRLLLSAPGKSGQTIAQLAKGTTNYANLISDVTYGLALANAAGKTYNVPAIVWLQGEQDASNSVYKAALVQLQKDLDTDIRAITGQTNPVKVITYQTASFNAFNNSVPTPTVAFEQYDTVTDPLIKHIHMGGAMYQFTYRPDYIHLTPTSAKLVGAMLAIAVKRVIIDGQDWKPIYVKKATRQGAIVELRFGVPTLPLVLDTALVSNPGNYGFRLFTSTGTELTITSVTLARPDTVRIVASTSIPAGAYVTYAAQVGTAGQSGPTGGQRGCLRDSQNIIFDPTGLNTRIYNWAPIFKYSII